MNDHIPLVLSSSRCKQCDQPLVEIDHWGERLVGCIKCNLWRKGSLKKEGEYFVCTDFRKPGSKDEYYDIDFWVNQKSSKLEVDNVKIHKVPVQEDGVWTQQPRYTFEGMDFDVTN